MDSQIGQPLSGASSRSLIQEIRDYVGQSPRLEEEIAHHIGVSEAVGAALLREMQRQGELLRGPDGLYWWRGA